MDETIEDMQKEAEEYADLHNEDCSCMMEDPDACDCEKMAQVHSLIKQAIGAENARWISLAKAHRTHCNPEGNKDITRMIGSKNR